MKTTFTQDYLLNNCGCYSQEQAKSLSFMQKNEFTIQDIINSEIPLKDALWFFVRKCELTVLQKKHFSIGCAKVVLVIFQNKYPKDDRPEKAIKAAEEYLKGELSRGELIEFRRAAYAAYAAAAAYAAYAAYAAAAAYAAYAAAADADDAAAAYADDDAAYPAYAAYAAYAAAAAADDDAAAAAYAAAADDDAYKSTLKLFLLDFIKNNKNSVL